MKKYDPHKRACPVCSASEGQPPFEKFETYYSNYYGLMIITCKTCKYSWNEKPIEKDAANRRSIWQRIFKK